MEDIFKRVGDISISNALFKTNPELVRLILAECIVVRCEMSFYPDCLNYRALSKHFDVIREGEKVPYYSVEINSSETSKPLTFKFIRKEEV